MRPKEPPNRRIAEREQVQRHGETERFRGLEIDHQFESGRRLNRQVGISGFLSSLIATR
jgi:hypothetical protein